MLATADTTNSTSPTRPKYAVSVNPISYCINRLINTGYVI